MEKKLKTVDCTPTWSGLMPAFLRILEQKSSEKARAMVRTELLRLAKAVDEMNAQNDKKRREVKP